MRTAFLMTALTVLLVLVGDYFGGARGMMMMLIISLAMNLFSYWNSDKLVLAFCEKTKNPDSVWKSGFYCLFFFKVVPPGIVIYFQVVEYHPFLKATQL